jgi:hypothetical protein
MEENVVYRHQLITQELESHHQRPAEDRHDINLSTFHQLHREDQPSTTLATHEDGRNKESKQGEIHRTGIEKRQDQWMCLGYDTLQ